MFKSQKLSIVLIVSLFFILIAFIFSNQNKSSLPIIAIANYGPHSSLTETIEGIKSELNNLGYKEGKDIQYEISDVNFDTSLIIQMLSKLKASKPKIIVTLSTPVTQAAKNLIKDIPVVYADVTDPVSAGLVSDDKTSNITGASDRQDLSIMLKLAKELLVEVKTVGVLYSTGEANDIAMVEMLKRSAADIGINVLAVPIEHPRDIMTRMKVFKGNADFIYTGSSGAISASLPAIVSIAEGMNLPLFNFNSEEVKTHNALASYGVSHTQVGANAAHIIDKILKGEKPANIKPLYPSLSDHTSYISKKRANKIGLKIPNNIPYVTIIE